MWAPYQINIDPSALPPHPFANPMPMPIATVNISSMDNEFLHLPPHPYATSMPYATYNMVTLGPGPLGPVPLGPVPLGPIIACIHCNSIYHSSNYCQNMRCNFCGQFGHLRNQCNAAPENMPYCDYCRTNLHWTANCNRRQNTPILSSNCANGQTNSINPFNSGIDSRDCGFCRSQWHISSQCPNNPNNGNVDRDPIKLIGCKHCGKTDHKSSDCRHNIDNIPPCRFCNAGKQHLSYNCPNNPIGPYYTGNRQQSFCGKCNKLGHTTQLCNSPVCQLCGSYQHVAPNCPYR